MSEWLLPIFGFLISIAAALTGVGGGIFVVPLLTLLYNFEPVAASGTSLATIVITSVASTINYMKQKRVYFKAGLALACATAPGGYLGAAITAVPLVKTWLGVIFGVFLIFVAFQMVYKALRTTPVKASATVDPAFEKALLEDRRRMLLGLLLSFFGGIVSGLLGVGGGVVLVPVMCYALGFPIYFSIPTSMFIMIFTSIFGVAGHVQQGNVHALYAVYLGLGSVVGAQFGAYASRKLSSKGLSFVFAAMLIVASVNMILKNLRFI
ncbi:MAG: sulfite exporter TauE/SafE family protein [Candidatus Bathyarchaeota archaeon]|nr:sulfite exporter TauE/SafE family protein [Candidatus Bathyarchaeota archaeon]